jgi:hypothetical protein
MKDDKSSNYSYFSTQFSEDEEISLLAERLALIEEKARHYSDQNSVRETIPAIFRRTYDEKFISDYLAYILDPFRNGIGTEPLQALLSLAFDNALEIDLEKVSVYREYTFNNAYYGRIDLLLILGEEGESGVVGIENKIYATEGGSQTISYAQGFENDFPDTDHFLIYLTPDGRQPASQVFKPVSYFRLCQVLREIHYPILDDIHKCVIWEDFLAHLEEYIVMADGKFELSGKTRLYLEYRQVLEMLNNAFAQDSQKVYDYVTAVIKDYFGEDWNFGFQGRNSFQEFRRKTWEFDNYYLFYQYRFSRENLLIKDQFPVMLGAYQGKRAKSFIDWFKENNKQIIELCNSYEMEAYPTKADEKNTILIAYKIYPCIEQDISKMEKQLLLAAEEFNVFTPIIDEAVREYKKITNNGK